MPESPAPSPVETIDGIVMVGGEMLNWSDVASPTGVFDSQLTSALLDRAGVTDRHRVLVLGPHHPDLVRDLAGRVADLQVLLRSWPDAQAMSAAIGPEIPLHCGDLARFEPSERFDLVVALDGLGRLGGTDLGEQAWSESLRRTTALLTAEGTLLLGVANPLSLGDLFAFGPQTRSHDWPGGGLRDLPLSLDQVRAAAADNNLVVTDLSATFPSAHQPTVAISDAVLDRHRDDDRLLTVITHAFDESSIDRDHFKDPRSLLETAVLAGQGATLASGWIMQVSGSAAPTPLPDVVLAAERHERNCSTVACLIHPTDDGAWRREVLPTSLQQAEAPSNGLVRRPELLSGALPAGRSLESELVIEAERHSFVGLRTLLQSWHRWLSDRATEGAAGPTCSGADVFSHLDNILHADGSFAHLDPSWRLTSDAEVPLDVVVWAALQRFAARLVSGGHEHPWPSGTSPARLARSLSTIVGLRVAESLREQTRAHLVRIDPVLAAPARPADVGPGTEADRPLAGVRYSGLDEANLAIEMLSRRVAERDVQVEWLINRIHQRERQLRRLRLTMRELRGSREFLLASRMLAAKVPFKRRRDAEEAEPAAHLWRPADPQNERDPALLPPGYNGAGPSGGIASQDDSDKAADTSD